MKAYLWLRAAGLCVLAGQAAATKLSPTTSLDVDDKLFQMQSMPGGTVPQTPYCYFSTVDKKTICLDLGKAAIHDRTDFRIITPGKGCGSSAACGTNSIPIPDPAELGTPIIKPELPGIRLKAPK